MSSDGAIRGFYQKSRQVWQQFCTNTSIHGLKYIIEKEASVVERVLWILAFVFGLCASGYFCWLMWQKWDESPILMSLDTNNYRLSNVPFPAVTICNVNKVSKSRLVAILSGDASKYRNVSYDTSVEILRYLTKLDRAILRGPDLQRLDAFLRSQNISTGELVNILQRTAPSCKDMIMDCAFQGLPKPCLEFFSERPTDDGYCCTFNGGNYTDVDLGLNYSLYLNKTLRVSGYGYQMGLAVILDADIANYSITNGKFDGFKVLVHSPDEFPNVADRGFVIGPGFETFVGVKVTTAYNTDDVGTKVSLKKRKCYVAGERHLDFFEEYSGPSCTVECATKRMLERCGCRPYFFRAYPGARLCDLTRFTCISDVYEEIRRSEDDLCNCLPMCTDEWYQPEISYAPFPGHGFTLSRTSQRLDQHRNLSVDYLKTNAAVLHVYYQEKTGDRYRIDIRFGVEDFISAMGGLLGLGLGFSLISGFELFYLVCVRWCLFRKKSTTGPSASYTAPLSHRSTDKLATISLDSRPRSLHEQLPISRF